MFNKTRIAAVLALSISVIVPVHASTISLSLSAESTSTVDSITDTAIPSVSSTSVLASSSQVSLSGFASGFSAGDNTGNFDLNGNVSGLGLTTSTFVQSYNVVNGNQDQFFDFTFSILNGSLDVGCSAEIEEEYGYGGDFALIDVNPGTNFLPTDGIIAVDKGPSSCSPNNVANAFYDASIMLNGTTIWDSFASLSLDNGSASIVQTGSQALATYTPGSTGLSWGEQTFTIGLDDFAANASFDLVYSVSLGASGSNTDLNDAMRGVGLYAYSQFGDPNSLGGTPVTSFSNPVNVSAPATMGLLGLGLIGLGWRKRYTK